MWQRHERNVGLLMTVAVTALDWVVLLSTSCIFTGRRYDTLSRKGWLSFRCTPYFVDRLAAAVLLMTEIHHEVVGKSATSNLQHLPYSIRVQAHPPAAGFSHDHHTCSCVSGSYLASEPFCYQLVALVGGTSIRCCQETAHECGVLEAGS